MNTTGQWAQQAAHWQRPLADIGGNVNSLVHVSRYEWTFKSNCESQELLHEGENCDLYCISWIGSLLFHWFLAHYCSTDFKVHTTNFPGNYPGYDDAWDMRNFQEVSFCFCSLKVEFVFFYFYFSDKEMARSSKTKKKIRFWSKRSKKEE